MQKYSGLTQNITTLTRQRVEVQGYSSSKSYGGNGTYQSSVNDRVRYRNDDSKVLLQDPEIVAFLMAVEIERLVMENNQLKSELREGDINSCDRVGYENQIKALLEKLTIMRMEIETLTIDNKKLVRLVEEMDNDLQESDNRQSQGNVFIDILMQVFGNTDPQDLKSQMQELKARALAVPELERQLDDYLSQINDLKDLLRQKDDEIDDLLKRIRELERTLNDKDRQISDYQGKLKNAEKNGDKYRQELEKTKQVISETTARLKEVERQSFNVPQLEDELQHLRMILDKTLSENDQLRTENLALKKQINELELELTRMFQESQMSLKQAQDQLQRAQDMLARSQQEASKASNELRQRDSELKNVNVEVKELRIQNEELHIQTVTLQQQVNQNDGQADEKQKEIDQLIALIEDQRDKIFHLESKFKQYLTIEDKMRGQEHRITLLMEEIERLNQLLKQITGDAEDWKQKYSRLELSLLEYRQMEMTNRDAASKAQMLAAEVERLKLLLIQRSKELEELRILYQQRTDEMMALIQKADSASSGQEEVLQRYVLVVAENERLMYGIKTIQEKFSQLQLNFNQLESEHFLIVQQYEIMKQKTDGIDLDEIEQMRQKLIQYEDKIALLSVDANRLKQRNASNNRLGSDNQRNSFNEIDQYQTENNQYNRNTQVVVTRSKSPDNRYQKRIQDLLCLVVMMGSEIDALRGGETPTAQPQVSQESQVVTQRRGAYLRTTYQK